MMNITIKLLGAAGTGAAFGEAGSNLLEQQLEGVRERLVWQSRSINALRSRVYETGIRDIRGTPDLLQLLLPYSLYKTYPSVWLANGRWELLGMWLAEVSTHRMGMIRTSRVADLQDWLEHLAAQGCFINRSGSEEDKLSLVPGGQGDREAAARSLRAALGWAGQVAQGQDHPVYLLSSPRAELREVDWYATLLDDRSGVSPRFIQAPLTPRAIEHASASLRPRPRRRLANSSPTALDGWHSVSDLEAMAQILSAARLRPVTIIGNWLEMEKLVQHCGQLHPASRLITFCSTQQPLACDRRDAVLDALGTAAGSLTELYTVSELNSVFPRCTSGRFHVPAWVMVLVLGEDGSLVSEDLSGRHRGRGAFVDLSHQSRWCGVISGDHIDVDYGFCECGRSGITIGRDVSLCADRTGRDPLATPKPHEAFLGLG